MHFVFAIDRNYLGKLIFDDFLLTIFGACLSHNQTEQIVSISIFRKIYRSKHYQIFSRILNENELQKMLCNQGPKP